MDALALQKFNLFNEMKENSSIFLIHIKRPKNKFYCYNIGGLLVTFLNQKKNYLK